MADLTAYVIDPDSGCWVWQKGIQSYGYGTVWYGETRSRRLAHRVLYELHRGPIPDGLFVLHRCDNPPCVNPDHLFLGTARDNAQDCVSKGRWPSKAGMNSTLTPKAVQDIRTSGESQKVLADRYGVSQSTISRAKNGKCWSHVK